MGWGMGVDMKSRLEYDFAYCEYTILRNLMIMSFPSGCDVSFSLRSFCESGRVLPMGPNSLRKLASLILWNTFFTEPLRHIAS